MDLSSKRILFINLEKETSEMKTFPDYKKYVGGLCLGLKILQQHRVLDPVVLTIGPLNGAFPYVSKTAAIFESKGLVEDIYLGGHLSMRMRFANLDGIVIYGKSKTGTVLNLENEHVHFESPEADVDSLGLPGKKVTIEIKDSNLVMDHYFGEPQKHLARKLTKKKVRGLSLTGTHTFKPTDLEKYQEIYRSLLGKTKELSVEKAFFPSCGGCPMGCEKSKDGEQGGNVLLHSLVACEFAEDIFTDVGTIFSCLNCLGYDYTHEDIEAVPQLVQKILKDLTE